ncbi:MAG: hypothetical protein Kow0063_14240 [Anaerolineae bacterium]
MFKLFKRVASSLLSLALLVTAATSALAAPANQAMVACEKDYVVQADDWLSKLADKYFGDVLAYPAIIDATNAAAQTDSSYATIANPDLIEIGWKLCIPSGAEAEAMMMGEEMMGEEMTAEEMTADEEMMGEEMMGVETGFIVRIENVGNVGQPTMTTPFAPGVWAVHTTDDPLFSAGQADRGDGLEALAEDGDPSALAAALTTRTGVSDSGIFNTPVGTTEPGPLLPGGTYEFTIVARPGDKLSFATMFVQSNDLFYAPDGAGIALFDNDGTPVSGDVTAQVMLWDAGTEVNQEPGVGPDQAPRQAGPDTGPDEGGVVQIVSDAFTYPTTSATIHVTITATETMMQ